MDAEEYWARFASTGDIREYLRYTACVNGHVDTKERDDSYGNRGTERDSNRAAVDTDRRI